MWTEAIHTVEELMTSICTSCSESVLRKLMIYKIKLTYWSSPERTSLMVEEALLQFPDDCSLSYLQCILKSLLSGKDDSLYNAWNTFLCKNDKDIPRKTNRVLMETATKCMKVGNVQYKASLGKLRMQFPYITLFKQQQILDRVRNGDDMTEEALPIETTLTTTDAPPCIENLVCIWIKSILNAGNESLYKATLRQLLKFVHQHPTSQWSIYFTYLSLACSPYDMQCDREILVDVPSFNSTYLSTFIGALEEQRSVQGSEVSMTSSPTVKTLLECANYSEQQGHFHRADMLWKKTLRQSLQEAVSYHIIMFILIRLFSVWKKMGTQDDATSYIEQGVFQTYLENLPQKEAILKRLK